MGRAQNDYTSEGFAKIGEAVATLGVLMNQYRDLEVYPVGLSIRAPNTRGGQFLFVLRGETVDEQRVVAFHDALEIGEGFRGLMARLQNGSLQWREDKFAKGG